jgi:hypothetical protein
MYIMIVGRLEVCKGCRSAIYALGDLFFTQEVKNEKVNLYFDSFDNDGVCTHNVGLCHYDRDGHADRTRPTEGL